MGYYSFYKLIKDIIITIFNKKVFRFLLISIIIAVVILPFLDTFVFAVDVTFQQNNEDVTISDINNPYDAIAIFWNTNYAAGSVPGRYFYVSWDSTTTKYGILPTREHNMKSQGGKFYYTTDKSNFSNSATNSGFSGNFQLLFTNTNIYNYSNMNEVAYEGTPIEPPFIKPIIYNKTEIQSNNFDNIVIQINNYNYENNLYFKLLYNPTNTGVSGDQIAYYYSVDIFILNYTCKYFTTSNNEQFYIIPKSELNLQPNKEYYFLITTDSTNIYNTLGVYNYENDENAYDGFSYNTGNTITEQQVTNNLLQNQKDEINKQTENSQNFYNNILSNDYNENQINDTLTNIDDSTKDIDDSQYIGLFSAIFTKFSNIISGDYSSIETISYPIMNTDGYIIITSDILSSKIQGTFIYTFLQIFWYFLFGVYIFKFSNNLIRKIKSGEILNGYENNNEVITSTML